MIQDDVLRQVRAAREAYCQQFGYDLEAIAHDLRERARAAGRELVSLPPRRPVRPVRNTDRAAAAKETIR